MWNMNNDFKFDPAFSNLVMIEFVSYILFIR